MLDYNKWQTSTRTPGQIITLLDFKYIKLNDNLNIKTRSQLKYVIFNKYLYPFIDK